MRVSGTKRFWTGVSAGVLMVAMSLAPASTVMALSDAILDFFAANGIYYYDPSGSLNFWGDCIYDIPGDTIQEKVMSFLLGQGYSPIAVAGIYGNMQAEGIGTAALLKHENGVNSISKVGTSYSAATGMHKAKGCDYGSHYGDTIVTEADVRNLNDPCIMHGVGFIQWSFGRRVGLMERLGSFSRYVTEWDGSKYVYDNYTYDDYVQKEGQAVADGVLGGVLGFLVDENNSYKVTGDDVSAQGLGKYGISAGMSLKDALNELQTPEEAATLFFTTSEMPSYTTLPSNQSARATYAREAYEFLQNSTIEASSGDCSTFGGALSLAIVDLAWDCYSADKDADYCAGGSKEKEPKQSYVLARQEASTPGDVTDCGGFVKTVLAVTGVDKNVPMGTPNQMAYYYQNTGKYEHVNVSSTADLQSGDILVSNGHTLFYIEIDGKGMSAQGSLGDHAPRITEGVYNLGDYEVFRVIGAK